MKVIDDADRDRDMRVKKPDPAPIEQPVEDSPIAVALAPEVQAVHLFARFGSLKEVARRTGIPLYELQKLSRTQQWLDELAALQREETATLNVRLSNLMNTTLEQIENRLEEGDVQLYEGRVVRHPCSASVLTKMAATIFDKRQLVRNLPTSIESSQSKLAELAEKLTQLGKARNIDFIDVEARSVESGSDDNGSQT